jgi:hypothetical protein
MIITTANELNLPPFYLTNLLLCLWLPLWQVSWLSCWRGQDTRSLSVVVVVCVRNSVCFLVDFKRHWWMETFHVYERGLRGAGRGLGWWRPWWAKGRRGSVRGAILMAVLLVLAVVVVVAVAMETVGFNVCSVCMTCRNFIAVRVVFSRALGGLSLSCMKEGSWSEVSVVSVCVWSCCCSCCCLRLP